MEASVILMKCNNKRLFGVRVQKTEDGDWWRTWAFPIDENVASREGFDRQQIQGNLYTTEEYPGCPFCEGDGFVSCGKCHRLSCWHGELSMACTWCGTYMENITPATEKYDLSSGNMY